MTITRTIEEEAERRAKLAGVPASYLLPAIEKEVTDRPIAIDYGHLAYGHVADVVYVGEQVRFVINLSHKWVEQVCWGAGVTPEMRSKIEVLLFSIFNPLDRDPEVRRFYDRESYQWGQRLEVGAGILFDADPKTGLNMFGDDPHAEHWEDDPE